MPKLDNFVQAYITCMLWSSTDESDESGGTPLDKNYTVEDLSPEALAKCIADCAQFQESMRGHLDACTDNDDSQAGHDFWLTRNGHGAGFWDGDWPEPQASVLTACAKRFGEIWAYVGDDGQVWL